MAPCVEEMWSDIKSVVIEHVSQDSPDDYTLAEYLGRTVSRDYQVGYAQYSCILPVMEILLHLCFQDYTTSPMGMFKPKSLKVNIVI